MSADRADLEELAGLGAAQPDSDPVLDFLRLLARPGEVREVRIPKHDGRNTASGYFDDPAAAAEAVRRWDGRANVYVTLNPVRPALLARAANRMNPRATSTTADADVLERRWLLVDIDPRRPSGISATDAEGAASLDVARAVAAYLAGRGWPLPVTAMSGNGHALLYPVALPNDAASLATAQGFLAHLAARFDCEAVAIDTTVSNAARIGAVVGTLKVKGDDTPDRPHRRSRLLHVPASLEPVPAGLLAELVPAPAAPDRDALVFTAGGVAPGWVRARLDAAGVEYQPHARNGIEWYLLASCPAHPGDGEAFACGVGEAPDGKAAGHCFHNRGSGWGWAEFRDALGLGTAGSDRIAARGPAGLAARRADSSVPTGTGDSPAGRLVRADGIAPTAVHWLWRDRMACGKLTMLDGRPGLGKSSMAVDLAARITTGRPMPDGFDAGLGPRDVILITGEDGLADTLVPRLIAAGADLRRVHFRAELVIPDGLPELEADIASVDAAFLLIDPLVAFVPSRVNLYRDQDARTALRPLADVAERTDCAVLGLRHVSKMTGVPAQDKGTGSVAIGGAARSNLIAGPDPDMEGRFALASIKNNLGPKPPALGYRLETRVIDSPEGPIEVGVVAWDGAVELDADDLVIGEKQGAAARFLEDFLADGARPSADVKKAAEAAGLSWAGAVRRASERLAIVKEPTAVGVKGSGWTWRLSDPPRVRNTHNTHNTTDAQYDRVEHRIERIEQKGNAYTREDTLRRIDAMLEEPDDGTAVLDLPTFRLVPPEPPDLFAAPARPSCFDDRDLFRVHRFDHYDLEGDAPGCRRCESAGVTA